MHRQISNHQNDIWFVSLRRVAAVPESIELKKINYRRNNYPFQNWTCFITDEIAAFAAQLLGFQHFYYFWVFLSNQKVFVLALDLALYHACTVEGYINSNANKSSTNWSIGFAWIEHIRELVIIHLNQKGDSNDYEHSNLCLNFKRFIIHYNNGMGHIERKRSEFQRMWHFGFWFLIHFSDINEFTQKDLKNLEKNTKWGGWLYLKILKHLNKSENFLKSHTYWRKKTLQFSCNN